jgi:pilus assembly protein CpaC
MSTRRVQTEVELESGQSFVIAGLLDNSLTETISKIPGLANIPLLGKLFTSRSTKRNNSELLVIVTPELVRPIPAGQPVPSLNMPMTFMSKNSDIEMHQPGIDKTGPVLVKPPTDSIPIEQLIQQRKEGQAAPPANPQFLIIPAPQAPPSVNPGLTPAPSSTGGTSK